MQKERVEQILPLENGCAKMSILCLPSAECLEAVMISYPLSHGEGGCAYCSEILCPRVSNNLSANLITLSCFGIAASVKQHYVRRKK